MSDARLSIRCEAGRRLGAETAARVVAIACTELPHEATHWTGRAMAKTIRICWVRCSASGRRTNGSRTGCVPSSARDPGFADKLTDVVGLGARPRAGHKPDPVVDPKTGPLPCTICLSQC